MRERNLKSVDWAQKAELTAALPSALQALFMLAFFP
jgi:hypothetical protein